MATVVEKRGDQTIYKSPDHIDLPKVDLLTFLFGESYGHSNLPTTPPTSAVRETHELTKSRLTKRKTAR